MTVSKYMNEIKLEECGFNGRQYEFTDSQNHLSERSQEMIFSTAILLYNQLVAELTRPAFQKLDRTAIATHVAQTPFPLWITSLEVEKGDISEPLMKRMIKPTKACLIPFPSKTCFIVLSMTFMSSSNGKFPLELSRQERQRCMSVKWHGSLRTWRFIE